MNKEQYGIFVWRGDVWYAKADAVRVYKSKYAANNFASKNVAKDYIVRKMSLISR